jgi:hypothetical protein
LNLIDNNVIGVNGKHIIVIIYVCYKIASNFAPNKKRLFFIFPFVPNMFHSSSQWVPLITPFFYERFTQDSDQKGFNHHFGGGGGSEEGEENVGWGEGKDIVATKNLLVATHMWRAKTF